MTDCVDGEVMLGGHQGPSSQPALQMEDLRLEEKLDRTLLNNTDGDADSGVDETIEVHQESSHDQAEAADRGESGSGGSTTRRIISSRIPRKTPPDSPLKKTPRARSSAPTEKRRMPRSKSVPKSTFAFSVAPPVESIKKVPMNKIVVGSAPSPNLMSAQSRIGSLSNTQHKPGGGNIRIENRKLEWNVQAKTVVNNDKYTPGGGDKKIENRKLNWNAQSKIRSLENHSYRPGGGDKKIENRKVEWKVDSRVGSTKNISHKAGGGNIRIHNEKLEFKVASRIGSLSNVKHKPGGGDKKIFDDKEYIRQINSEQNSLTRSGPGSLAGSIMGSHNQLYDGPKSLDYNSLKRSRGKTHVNSLSSTGTDHLKLQLARNMSPKSNGF